MLLYAGANVKATSRLGRYTPLHVASQGGAAPVVTALLARGAEVTATTGTGATRADAGGAVGPRRDGDGAARGQGRRQRGRAAHGQTALMFAAAYDRAEVVRLLVARGATVDVTSKVVDLAALTDPGDGEGRPPEPQGGPTRARPAAAARAAGSGRRGRRDAAVPLQRTHRHARAGCRRCISPRGRAPPPRRAPSSRPAPTSTCAARATGRRRSSSPR